MREQRVQTGVDAAAEGEGRHSLKTDLTLYTLARFGMIVLATGILVLLGVPLLVAAAVAVVLMMPLSLFVLRGVRQRVVAGLAERSAHRRAQRERLRAQLRGERDGEVDDGAGHGDERRGG